MATTKGTAVSFNNTPQAKDDFFSTALTGLTEDNLASQVLLLDVMPNDAGGNAKSLYSLDDGINSAGVNGDLLQQDTVGSVNRSLHGATIKITADGKVSYDASTLDASFATDLQHLAAGEFATDSFTYAIRLGNGTLSWATATVQIAGVNDAPVVSGPVIGNATEDGPTVALNALANATDVDHGAVLSVTNVASQLPAGVSYNPATHSFTLDPSNGAYQYLAQGRQTTVTVNYDVTDGIAITPSSASWIVTGTNDAPAAVADQASAKEDTLPNPVSGNVLSNDTDVDTLDTHSVTAVNGAAAKVGQDVAGTYGTLHLNADGSYAYVLDNTKSSVQALAEGQQVSDVFAYTNSDNNGGSSTSTLTINITGSNDAPTLQAAVATAPVLSNDSITVADTLAFADLDLTDTHAVTFTPQGSNYIGDFLPVITADANGHGSITATYHLTIDQFNAAGGVFPDHQDYLVTIDDHHGGTSSQIVSIPLSDLLSGDGGGGPPTVQPPVFINGANTFTIGNALGQIVDNPWILDPGAWSTDLYAQGTLYFSDPDGGNHQASVDLSHALIVGHFLYDSNGAHPVLGDPIVGTSTGTWQVYVQDPGEVHWSYTLPESAIRGMASGEAQTMIFPITVYEDGVGQSTQNVRIDLLGTDEPTSLLAPNTVLTANTDISPYLLPIDLATHVQMQDVSITEDPLVTGSTSHHTVSGTISFVDPDLLDRPTVNMTVADMHHDPGDPFNAVVQPLMDGFSYTVEQFGNYGMIHWTYDVQDSALDFLAEGSVVTASANFNVGTGPGGGGGTFSTVNVNLHGANDAPVIQGSNTTFVTVAMADHNITSGSFIFTDPDWYPDGHIVEFVPHNPDAHGFIFGGTPVETGQGGSEQVTWNYSPDVGVGALLAGQHDVWDVVVQDHFGALATHMLDFHLV